MALGDALRHARAASAPAAPPGAALRCTERVCDVPLMLAPTSGYEGKAGWMGTQADSGQVRGRRKCVAKVAPSASHSAPLCLLFFMRKKCATEKCDSLSLRSRRAAAPAPLNVWRASVDVCCVRVAQRAARGTVGERSCGDARASGAHTVVGLHLCTRCGSPVPRGDGILRRRVWSWEALQRLVPFSRVEVWPGLARSMPVANRG